MERERKLVLRMLRKQVGILTRPWKRRSQPYRPTASKKLGEALLDFKSLADLDAWLDVIVRHFGAYREAPLKNLAG